ncbi:MAG: tyrosine--tRNA ligase, partial [Gemmatimonas sp.]
MNELPAPIFELAWRELLSQHTEGLADALRAGQVTAYCGFDPTASSLHVGNLVPVMALVHLQRAGHRPIALVGGGTGMIGDPSGKSSERVLQDADAIAANAVALRGQLERFLRFDGANGARLLDNAAWLGPLSLLEFLRDTGKHFSVNYMLAKDSVKSRLDGGISFTEFSYMLLQAYDYLELHRREGVTLQIGGSDQWGNITAGLELIRRTNGHEAHALTLPLVTNANGTKFGKSESGAVWLDSARTSPYQFYQFWMGTDDRDVSRYLRYFTLLSREEIETLDASVRMAPEARAAQRALATDVTARVHGDDAARVAREVSVLLFEKGEPSLLSDGALDALRSEIPFATYSPPADVAPGGDGVDVYECLTALGFAASRGVAKRLLEQGGVSVNGVKLAGTDRTVGTERLLRGQYLLVKK